MDACPRCGAPLTCASMSYFNTEDVCCACKREERGAPGFARARAVEEAEVRRGNYRYPGVGLGAEDRAYLARRRAERTRAEG